MSLKKLQRRLELKRRHTLRRFHRHKRKNLLACPGLHPYIIVLDNLKPTFNIGKIFRSADAFGAHEVHLVGTDFFDPAPAAGSFKWVPARFHESFDTCHKELTQRGYALYTLETGSSQSLLSVGMPERSAFIFGHEEFGISFDKADYQGITSLQIPQFGKTQSLNVSVAASIVMYEYIKQHGNADLKMADVSQSL